MPLNNSDPPHTRYSNGALAAIGGAIGTLFVFVLGIFVDIPAEANAVLVGAITTLVVTLGTEGIKNFFVGLWKGVNGGDT